MAAVRIHDKPELPRGSTDRRPWIRARRRNPRLCYGPLVALRRARFCADNRRRPLRLHLRPDRCSSSTPAPPPPLRSVRFHSVLRAFPVSTVAPASAPAVSNLASSEARATAGPPPRDYECGVAALRPSAVSSSASLVGCGSGSL